VCFCLHESKFLLAPASRTEDQPVPTDEMIQRRRQKTSQMQGCAPQKVHLSLLQERRHSCRPSLRLTRGADRNVGALPSYSPIKVRCAPSQNAKCEFLEQESGLWHVSGGPGNFAPAKTRARASPGLKR